MKKEGSIRTARIADNIVTYLILIVISLIFLFPCVWLIAASFSKSGDIHSFSGFFPEEFSVQTFVDLFTDDVNGLYPYGRWFLNTLYVATMTCIIGTLLTILTGYVMSRFRFNGPRHHTQDHAAARYVPRLHGYDCGLHNHGPAESPEQP